MVVELLLIRKLSVSPINLLSRCQLASSREYFEKIFYQANWKALPKKQRSARQTPANYFGLYKILLIEK